MTTKPDDLGSERERPDQCAVGDWMTAKQVPDWSIHERLHAFVPPLLEGPPAPAVTPVTHPALTLLFEQSSILRDNGTEAVIWVRKE